MKHFLLCWLVLATFFVQSPSIADNYPGWKLTGRVCSSHSTGAGAMGKAD